MLTIKLKMVSIFRARRSPIAFEHVSFWCPFLDPQLTTYHSNIGVQTNWFVGIGCVYLNPLPQLLKHLPYIHVCLGVLTPKFDVHVIFTKGSKQSYIDMWHLKTEVKVD